MGLAGFDTRDGTIGATALIIEARLGVSMTYSNYRDVELALRDLRPFRGNTASAEWVDTNAGRVYQVKSYDTVIARVYASGNRVIEIRDYSQTTSRLKNMTARAWSGYPLNRDYLI